MFWINYLLLCGKVNKAPTALAKELGITSGTVSGWKNGKIPSQKNLQKIADYFGITVWDLLGEKKTAPDYSEAENETVQLKEELKNNYAFRILFDATNGSTESDLLEAAALLTRRKEERGIN